MNKGHVLPMQQMIAGSNPNSWNIISSNMMMRPPTNSNPQQSSPNYYYVAPPASSMLFPHYISSSSSSSSSSSCYENQDQLPESLSQLLLGGVVGEEDKSCLSHIQAKKLENWEEQLLLQHHTPSSHEYQAVTMPRWSPVVPVASPQNSSSATITSNSNPNILDFSDNKADGKRSPPPGHSPECNSTATGGALKKARVQTSSTPSTFKVRKEKLGDRITALHQIVSPFGKTDTASVLLEAIGYIRFLHNQVEALSIPYLGTRVAEMRHQQSLLNDRSMKVKEAPGQEPRKEPKKDLRSRGLCLVPISCTLQVGSDNGADYWTPALGGGF